VTNVERIDLAHAGEFRLGCVTVRPQLRQLLRDDGDEEIVEPRVMQVLVALVRADGAILSRDDLTTACWEGRVVGEDAINRVISRLRRTAEGIGAASFRIETVTKVGYRLIAGEGAPVPAIDEVRQVRIGRRAMLIAGGVALAGAAGIWWGNRARPALYFPSPEVAALMTQAITAAQQGTNEGTNQAIGLLRRIVELAPDYADGWGMLAAVYAGAAQARAEQQEADLRARSEAASQRALSLDPANAFASLAAALLQPLIGNWLAAERALRTGLARHPANQFLLSTLSWLMLSVGRCRESAELVEAAYRAGPPSPGLLYLRVQLLWSAGRLDDADRAMAEAHALYPSHFAVWFTRFYLLLYTGRAQQALALSQDLESRPSGIQPRNFESIELAARAMLSRAPADIEKAIAANVELAHQGAGFAEVAMQFASALGRLDTAFEIAGGYFFGTGFKVGDLRFAPEQRVYSRIKNRRTLFLFCPSTAAMRADPRFEVLAERMGMSRYWSEAGARPDYLVNPQRPLNQL
jgi:DNA-binding winged helix-turn-helix (wHTH) protein/predicted Zn-dependent protease